MCRSSIRLSHAASAGGRSTRLRIDRTSRPQGIVGDPRLRQNRAAVSFLDKARQATERARQVTEQAVASATSEESQARMQAAAKGAGGGLRGAAGSARKGMITLVEKIDPGLLADIIIKATALQERTNSELTTKRSAYRIGELTITATIPPQIGFAITRISDDDLEELRAKAISAEELVEAASSDAIVSLDADADGNNAADEVLAER
jgi:hypothetical protein